jgi:D-glycero-D-manno-heptose 1,7-bisphosphate phosphatase
MKAAFLDRDGVLNREVGYLCEVSEFQYIGGTKSALKNLQRLGYEIVIITNQSGIGRGLYTEEKYHSLTNYYLHDLSLSGIHILDVFYCPHYWESNDIRYQGRCSCRKPAPGMIEQAAKKHYIDLRFSVLVGDKLTDIEAGRAAGISKCFLVESGHELPPNAESAAPVLKNLLAVSRVLGESINEAVL